MQWSLGKFLVVFVSSIYQQDDWIDYLHLVEFPYNNLVSFFYQIYSFLCQERKPSLLDDAWTSKNLEKSCCKGTLLWLQEIQITLSHYLQVAQATHKKFANLHHIHSTPETQKLQVGDCIWLLRSNVKTTLPCNKLDYQRLSPYITPFVCVFI